MMINKESVFPAISRMAADIRKNLSEHVKGQTYAIYCVQEAIFEAFTVQDPAHKGPKLCILMTGLPGVGKTEMVEQLAKQLGLPYLRVNMSSYSDKEESVFNFKGINESYKSAREGDVTKFVKENPNGILLFDEVDKAHQNVLSLLYQVLEGGELEDDYTRKKISFRENLIFMTTNVGAELFQDLDRYNYATLPEGKILNALRTEKNPTTGNVCFSPALASRFAKGKIVPFNRLTGTDLCEIGCVKAREVFALFAKRYPSIPIECDEYGLSRSLLLSKGVQADARNLTGAVNHFFGTHLFNVMQKYEENGEDFSKLSKIAFSFNFADAEDRVKRLLETQERYRVAVCCSREERALFDGYTRLDLDFVDAEQTVTSLNYDCAIVGVDLVKNERAMEYFRKLKKQDDLPAYVFTMAERADEIDMKPYYCEGCENAYLPKSGKQFFEWLDAIAENVRFARLFSDLGRANLVLNYDTLCSYEQQAEGVIMRVDTMNYRLERSVNAEDEGEMVRAHEIPKERFSDVKGLDSTVEAMQDYLKFLKGFKSYARRGIDPPRGVLLYGPPGTGKTLLAKAIAGESDMPIFERNATEYVQSVVGGTARAIRKDFTLARKYAPSIVFIDEVDAIAKPRGGLNGIEERESGLNALLSEMDGFRCDVKKPVFVIAATNFEPNDERRGLDSAFVRRFDRRIRVNLPDSKSRLEILQYYLGKYSASIPELMLMNIVRRSPGKSPADLRQIVEHAVRQSMGRTLEFDDLEEAFETVAYGDKKEWDEETVRKTSFHEAGHALVAWYTGNTPAYVTNVSRGSHGGYMQFDSEEDKLDYTRQDLLDKICVCFAGRAAELAGYGKDRGVTTGAGSDIEQARKFAYMLVDEYAMDEGFLLGSCGRSETSKSLADERVSAVLAEQYARSIKLVTRYDAALRALVELLMQENSLDARRIDMLLTPLIPDRKRKDNKGGVAV